jgi:hypothetical protein
MKVEIDHTPKNVKILSIPGLEDQDLIDQQEEQLKLQKEKEQQELLLKQQREQQAQLEEQNKKSESPAVDQIPNPNPNNTTNDDNMDMFFDNQAGELQRGNENGADEEEETATDSFFNEMVDTGDDDPSVNEFLNTE